MTRSDLMERLRQILKLASAALAMTAAFVILFWLFVVPPAIAFFGGVALYGIVAVAVTAVLLRFHRIGWCAFALAVLAAIPPAMTLEIGLYRYLNLDAASYADENWKDRALPEGKRPLVVHLSDTHFIGDEEGRTREGDDWNVRVLEATRDKILGLNPKFVILSGDITDDGSESQWRQAERVLLSPLKSKGVEIVMAPGNHDLQPFFESSANAPAGRQISEYLKATATYDAGFETRAGPVLSRRLAWEPPSKEAQEKITEQWQTCLSICTEDGYRSCLKGCDLWLDSKVLTLEKYVEDACGAWFPMTHVDKEGAAFIVLCSNLRLVDTAGTNAIGELGNEQIAGLNDALRALPVGTRQVFVVLHHPVVKRPNDRFGLPAKWTRKGVFASSAFEFATLPNRLPESQQVVAVLQKAASSNPDRMIHLAFGHRHGSFLGKIDPLKADGRWVWVSEAPAAYDPKGGIWVGYDSPGKRDIQWRWWSVAVDP